MWQPLPLRVHSQLHAQHTVFFSIDTAPPLSVAHLSFTLLHFVYLAIQASVTADYYFDPLHLPRITHLTYQLTPGPVIGIAYFDNLHHAFANATAHGIQLMATHSRPLTVITTWPPDVEQVVLWQQRYNFALIARCNRWCRYVFFVCQLIATC